MNIYAPNVESERSVFFKTMQHNGATSDIIMGDFNVKLCLLDRNEKGTFKTDTSRTILKDFMLQKDWCDVWRGENPLIRAYSRMQNVKNVLCRSRIDLCLVKQQLIHIFHNAHYNFTFLSDHAFLSVNMGELRRRKGGGLWHLNAKLLENKNYIKCISNLINTVSLQPVFKNAVKKGGKI